MVATIPTPPQGGMVGILQFEGSSSSINIMMCDQMVKLQIQACNYDIVTHQNVTLKCRIYLHLSVTSVVYTLLSVACTLSSAICTLLSVTLNFLSVATIDTMEKHLS